MRIFLVALVIIVQYCHAQDDYHAALSARLEEIRKLDSYNNSAVVFDDSSIYDYPRWNPAQDYYQDDVVTYKRGICYLALVDNKGKNPVKSPNEWKVIVGPHPYLFFKDTARIEDLKALLASDHPFIRCYAFAALAHRKYDDLFQVVVDNLSDTTRILQFTSDYGYEVYPADLMLWYKMREFTVAQKNVIRRLILTKYTHLEALRDVLLFHKPLPEEYPYVREIAKKNIGEEFGLVALSRYRMTEDIVLIQTGFKDPGYWGGLKFFFLAIENFPHPAFKKDLIDYSKEVKADCRIIGHDYYYLRSLAAMRDEDCLKVLEGLVSQKCDGIKDNRYQQEERTENLRAIYQALKKYYTSMYDGLIKKIETEVSSPDNADAWSHRWIEENPWND